MKLFRAAFAAAALCLLGAPALAQTNPVSAPAGFAPIQAVCFGDLAATCVPVSATNPLPTTATLSGSITASTEYTEDAAAAANPVGGVMIGVRRDTLSASEVSADGDNVAIKATSKGQLHTYAEIGSSALPTGAATAANQVTEHGYVDGLEALITSTNTKLDTLANNQVTGIFYTGTTTPLTSSATYTGTARDVGVAASAGHRYAYFNGFFFADQAGTATLECSNDSSTWYTCATSALVASTPLTLSVPVMFRYHRTKLVNGGTGQATLVVNASYTGG